ncbi:MAG TPA: hypothetical protein VM238_14880 [Phycisphaerae bacterium]|nr:hypothetical protein [Phycisphaerae bacterium]
MAGESVKYNVVADSAKALAEMKKVVDLQGKTIQGLQRTARESKKTGDEGATATGKIASSIASIAAGYLSVNTAMGTIRQGYGLWLEDVKAAAEASKELVDSYRTLAIMKGQEWPGFKAALTPLVTQYAGPGGVGAGYGAAETVVSLLPQAFGFTEQDQLDAARQTLQFGEAYGMQPDVAAQMIGKAQGMMSKHKVTPRQWANALAGMIKQGGYAGTQLQEWAGAMPTMYGAALTADMTPAETLAFSQVMSQVTGSPGEGMGGGEQALRLIMAEKAGKAFPGMKGLGAMDRMGYLAGEWERQGPAAMRPRIEKAFGARGMRYVPRALERWDLYDPAMATAEAGLTARGDVVAQELGSFRQLDPQGRIAATGAIARNMADMARAERADHQRIAAGRDILETLMLESGRSGLSRQITGGLYNLNAWMGRDAIEAMEMAQGFGTAQRFLLPAGEREAWDRLRPSIERALGYDNVGEQLDRIGNSLERIERNQTVGAPNRPEAVTR